MRLPASTKGQGEDGKGPAGQSREGLDSHRQGRDGLDPHGHGRDGHGLEGERLDGQDLRAYFHPDHLGPLADLLGFRPEDRAELLHHAAALDEADLGEIARARDMVREALGHWSGRPGAFDPFGDGAGRPRGLIPMFALLAGVPAVRAEHDRRGIPEADTYGGLADLGQQVAVYRQTFGEFGLDSQGWLVTVWAGAFFWLGRLQANLIPHAGGHVISVHIPETGPLRPEDVDDSFARARDFFGRYFPEAPAHALQCNSWLLDPQLAQVVKPESNLASFQRRWRLVGEPREADASIIYFVFRRRARPGEELDLTGLPRRTSLERAVLEHLDAGGHWYAYVGLIDLD